MRLDPWPFILAAYALTVLGAFGFALWSYVAMRRAEAEAEALGKRP